MKIEKIKKQGKKYKIILDDGEIINTYDDVIIKNNLLYNKNLNKNLLDKISIDTSYYENYNKAIKMISIRQRSQYEIEKYLEKNKIQKQEIEKIINTLKNIGLIDDSQFAKAYTNDKINLSLEGPNKIQKDLEKHKIDKTIIQEVINSIDQQIINQNLAKIIAKKTKNPKQSENILKQKLSNYLINQGYDQTMIKEALENIHVDIQVTYKEMEKVHKKLAQKYKENELYTKLKNKLYTKGYKIEEINQYINQIKNSK